MLFSTYRRCSPRGAGDRETYRAPAALGWEDNVPGIRQTDLQELIAYLEKCSRNGEGADLPQEWARQLLLVLNARGDVLPAKTEPLIDPLECDRPRHLAPRR